MNVRYRLLAATLAVGLLLFCVYCAKALADTAPSAYWGTSQLAAALAAPRPVQLESCGFRVGHLTYLFAVLPDVGRVVYLIAAGRIIREGRVAAKDWPCVTVKRRSKM